MLKVYSCEEKKEKAKNKRLICIKNLKGLIKGKAKILDEEEQCDELVPANKELEKAMRIYI